MVFFASDLRNREMLRAIKCRNKMDKPQPFIIANYVHPTF